MFLIMGLCFSLSAFALLGGAVWSYFRQRSTMQSRVAATGTVVELVNRTTSFRGGSILYPVVEFTLPAGDVIRFTSDFGSRPARYSVGERVNIRYDAADLQKAEIESTMSLWLTPIILVFLGVIACCLGIVFVVVFGLGPSTFQR